MAGSLRDLRSTFRALPEPELALLVGDHRASFTGPAALRAIAPHSLAPAGLPHWFGKRFAPGPAEGPLAGVNLVGPPEALEERLPMRARVAPSLLDGRPAIVVTYAADARPPWRWVRDELRSPRAGELLGMSFADLPGLRRLPLPFRLERVDDRA